MRTPTGSKRMSDNYITRCHRRLGLVSARSVKFRLQLESVGDKMPAWELACRQRTCDPQWPTIEQPKPECGRSAAMVRRTLGQYVAVCPRLQLTSHTQPTSTFRNPFANLSRIKCERYIFYKEVCSFVHWSSSLLLTMLPRMYYVYVCGYTTSQTIGEHSPH